MACGDLGLALLQRGGHEVELRRRVHLDLLGLRRGELALVVALGLVEAVRQHEVAALLEIVRGGGVVAALGLLK